MTKELRKAQISIAFSVITLLISLLVYFSLNGSTAWFMKYGQSDADGMKVRVDNMSNTLAEVKSYAVAEMNSNVSSTQYVIATKNGEFIELNNVPQYDPNAIASSEFYIALLVVIEITAPQTENLAIMAMTTNTEVSYEKDNFISNVINITNVSITDTTAVKTGTSFAFTAKNSQGTECTKVSSGMIYSGSVPQGLSKIAFLIEYNEDFLSVISSKMMLTGQVEVINYTNDLVFRLVNSN